MWPGGLLFGALGVYQQSVRASGELETRVEGVAAARLFLQTITAELQACRHDDDYRLGLRGNKTRIEFLSTVIPRANWSHSFAREYRVPESDLRLVTYELGGGRSNSVGFQEHLDPALDTRFLEDILDEGKRADGDILETEMQPKVQRTELRLYGASRDRQRASQIEPLSPKLRQVQFRYFDGRNWRDDWGGNRLPRGVEVTVSLEDRRRGEENDDGQLVFRRQIHLPACSHFQVNLDRARKKSEEKENGEAQKAEARTP